MGQDGQCPKTDIVIVGWNKLDLTHECIESIRKNTDPSTPYQIFYVDNGSEEDVESFLTDHKDVLAVLLTENTGFPHGANVGLALSLIDSASEYVLLLNNDTRIQNGDAMWLARMIDAMNDPTVGAVGAVSDRVFGWQRRDKAAIRLQTHAPALIFFAVLLRKKAVFEVGLLDERFSPGNFEDFDYSVRLTKAGWEMMVAQDVWIHHVMHASHNPKTMETVLSLNRQKFVDKWGIDAARKVGVV